MSGHSKWAQIKHKKAVTDAKKGQLFSKLVREIMIAARESGENPETNYRLKAAMERARSLGLPKDNITRAIARATGGGEAGALQEFLYEATAPDGIMILIRGITDNKNRTLASIKQILLPYNARIADPGSVAWSFQKIGSLEIHADDNSSRTPEALELDIIESGAEDFKKFGADWMVETKPAALENVRRGLEERGVIIEEAGPNLRPHTPIALPPEKQKNMESLREELSNQEDVQTVYTNYEEHDNG